MSMSDILLLVNNNLDKTLNEQLKDMIALDYDETTMYSERNLGVALQDGIAVVRGEPLTAVSPKNLKIDARGRVSIKAIVTCRAIAYNGSVSIACYLYKNGVYIGSGSTNVYNTARDYQDATITVISDDPVQIERGDVVSLEFLAQNNSSSNDATVRVANVSFDVQIYAIPKVVGLNYFYAE